MNKICHWILPMDDLLGKRNKYGVLKPTNPTLYEQAKMVWHLNASIAFAI